MYPLNYSVPASQTRPLYPSVQRFGMRQAAQFPASPARKAVLSQNQAQPLQFGLSFNKALGLKNGENQKMFSGYLMRYGTPLITIGVGLISGPCACIFVPLGLLASLFVEHNGRKRLNHVQQNKLSGAPKHANAMREIWQKTNVDDIKENGDAAFKKFKKHYNKFIGIALKDKKSLLKRLTMKKGKTIEKWASKIFHVQAIKGRKLFGRAITRTGKIMGAIPLLRIPALIFTWSMRGLQTLFSWRKAERILSQGIKNAAKHA